MRPFADRSRSTSGRPLHLFAIAGIGIFAGLLFVAQAVRKLTAPVDLPPVYCGTPPAAGEIPRRAGTDHFRISLETGDGRP